MAPSQTALKQIKDKKEQEEFGSISFKKFFLLQFTKELIKHLDTSEILKLENILKEQAKEREGKIKHIIKKKEKRPQEMQLQIPITIPKKKPLLKPLSKLSPKPGDFASVALLGQRVQQKPLVARPSVLSSVLRIPESKLPPRFQYLKPTPTNIQIDLEKLNPLIKDPMVKDIECNGPDKNIIVRGGMGTKKTNIILSKEEINEIIKKFSETAKIPIQEGVFKVVAGRLILSAIISDVIGSKFIIKKMMYNPYFRR